MRVKGKYAFAISESYGKHHKTYAGYGFFQPGGNSDYIISFLPYPYLDKNTRAWSLLKGLAFILGFWLIAAYFHMTTILWLGRNIIGFAVTALIVVLQPELRKALEELGNKEIITNVLPFTGSKGVESSFSTKTINEIVKACVEMGKVRTGALIVIEGKQPLGDFERTGIEVDGIVTSQLLINILNTIHRCMTVP